MYTDQSGHEGQRVKAISICEKVDVVNEHYLAFVQNRSSPTGIEVILQPHGGSDVMKRAKSVVKMPLQIQDPLDPKVSNVIADHLGIDDVHGQYGFDRQEAIN